MGGIAESIGSGISSLGSGVGNIVGSFTGATQAGKGAQKAAEAQQASAQAGIDEQRRQFDEMMKVLAPYVGAGTGAIQGMQPYAQAGAPALAAQQALAGLAGPEAQQAAIAQIASSPEMQAMVKQGEEAMLQRAAATGGLRGGNVQAALAQFRPQMLSELINQQYGRLGGLTALGQQSTQNLAQLGQASAAGQGAGGLQTAANIASLLGQQGAAEAGGIMGKYGVTHQAFGDLVSLLGAMSGKSGDKGGSSSGGMMKLFGGP